MKRFTLFFATLVALLFSLSTLQAQKKADIYHFTFLLEEELVNDIQVEREGGGFLSGFSSSPIFPEAIIDSIKQATETVLSEKLEQEVRCLLVTTTKGKPFVTVGMEGGMDKQSLEGLPLMQFKKAIENSKADLFVQVLVTVEDGKAVRVDLGMGKNKIKPVIAVTVKAYDSDKKVVWKSEAKLDDFEKLRQKTSDRGTHKVRTGETLTPESILEMYLLALEEVVKA